MNTYPPELFPVTALALTCAVVTMFFSIHLLHRLYSAFGAPLATIERQPDADQKADYNGCFWLYASYVACGMIFAYTGGTIGLSADEFDLKRTGSHIAWGFSAGILVAGLARLSAVYVSCGLAQVVQLLSAAAAGLLAYKLVSGHEFVNHVVDYVLRPGAGEYFPVFAVLSTAVVCLTVEFLVYIGRRNEHLNRVPISLLTERREQALAVLQMFWAEAETSFTESRLEQILAKEGLSDLCWLTNVARPDHMREAYNGLVRFYEQKRERNPVAKASDTFREKARIIICDPENHKRFLAAQLAFVDPSNVKMKEGRVQERKLTINKKHAFVHLPIPYKAGPLEQSNCAMYMVDTPECVEPLCREFEAIWQALPPQRRLAQ